jgi:WW domain-binding protein 11
MEVEYEKRRIAMVTYAESVRHAQQVQVDDIPLPTLQLPNDPNAFMGLPSQIPLPTDLPVPLSSIVPHPIMTLPVPPGLALPPPHGILKKTSAYTAVPVKPKKPPGVPPGPPPELSDDDEEEPMDEDGKEYCILKLEIYGLFVSLHLIYECIQHVFIIHPGYPCLILLSFNVEQI